MSELDNVKLKIDPSASDRRPAFPNSTPYTPYNPYAPYPYPYVPRPEPQPLPTPMPNAVSTEETWFKSYWRPAMAYVYMIICFMDFVGFPLLSMFIPTILHVGTYVPWKTLTLENGGLIHMAFGAILGITAWTRGTEKITQLNNEASREQNNMMR